MRTFAGIASLPGRPLERALRSLRPQVDELGVFLNGYDDVPPYVRELRCHWIRDTGNAGSSAKLTWAPHWDGWYFACDDDLDYPPDYVGRLLAEAALWAAPVLVTACGRRLQPDASSWHHWMGEGSYIAEVPEARWINYLGGCAFAFDAREIKPPPIVPMNEEEAVLSVWAQRQGVPIRLIARPYDWPRRIPLARDAFTLYEQAARERFATRSTIIRRVHRWEIHEAEPRQT